MKTPPPPVLTPDDRQRLERWVRAATTPQRVVRRSRIVLLAAEGLSIGDVAGLAGVSVPTVRLWVRRFRTGGPDALLRDAPGRGRPARLDPDAVARAAASVGGSRSSIRQIARALGASPSATWRALKKAGGGPARG